MRKSGFSNKILAIFLFCVSVWILPDNLHAQNINTGSVVFDKNGYTFDISILYEKTEIKTCPNITYYWYRNGELKSTKGDYSGNLLHGKYEKFDSLNNLRSKGHFHFGVKDGIWKYWNALGSINMEEIWKKGLLQKRTSVDNGVTTTQTFKNNRLHGKENKIKEDELVSSTKYHNGQVKQPQKKKLLKKVKGLFRKKNVNEAENSQTNTSKN